MPPRGGAVLGALFLTFLPEWLRAIENFDILVYGAILILCMMFLPGGLAEGAQKAWEAASAPFRRRGAGAPPGGGSAGDPGGGAGTASVEGGR
jgi:branched-chain amino acid transport system permease protein